MKKRYHFLDSIRGISLLNMILYHTIWDLVYVFGVDWKWYRSNITYVWQQSICWTFIFLSGFCWSLGRHHVKRGILVFLGGMVISAITLIFMPQNRVLFGVLTLIGSSMLFLVPLDKIFAKKNCFKGFLLSITLFIVTRNINNGYLGFEKWNILKLPKSWYRNLFTAYFGMPKSSFFSTDYVSIFPWIFLFLAGYFAYHIFHSKDLLKYLEHGKIWGIEWLGKHSFEIYLLHQPVIYLILSLLFL